MSEAYPFDVFVNPRHGIPGTVVLPISGFRRAADAITAWPGYEPTPLHDLPNSGIACLRLKDEGQRFGLGSFKALGGAYAVQKLLAGRNPDDITVTCATDGNHGRSVAWGARRFGCRCVIFIHQGVSPGRAAAIEAYGAEIRRIPGNYDDSVREAGRQATQHGWFVVSDTSYPGYTEVPRDVMQGYRLMADEAADQWIGPPPTHVFIQAGVGGAAAAVSVQIRLRFTPTPRLIVVEPNNAACLMASARAGITTTVVGALDTIMAGLACGEPSLIAWQELERAADAFMAIPDAIAADCMRALASQGLAIGESGVAGLAGFQLAMSHHKTQESLGLDAASRVLVFGTEGITDASVYDSIIRSRQS